MSPLVMTALLTDKGHASTSKVSKVDKSITPDR